MGWTKLRGASSWEEFEGSKGRHVFQIALESGLQQVGKPFGCGMMHEITAWSQTSDLLRLPGALLVPRLVQTPSTAYKVASSKVVRTSLLVSDFRAPDANIPSLMQQTASQKMLE